MHDTRQTIIDVAVDLISEIGYANTEIHDILKRAAITKGAFYNHFPTKEAVVAAIIAEADIRTHDVIAGVMSTAASTLENLIVATLAVADMTERDSLARTGNLLQQSLIRLNHADSPTSVTAPWSMIETAIKTAIADGDLLDDINVDAMALTIRAALIGTRMLSDTAAEDVFGRLAKVWQVILRGSVPAAKLAYFDLYVTRVAAQYSTTR